MKSYNHKANTNGFGNNHKINHTNGFLPYSLKFISSCIKTASSGVRSAGASVAASISSSDGHEHKDQVLWCCFDSIELGPTSFKHVLLLGYSNGFQVLDVEDASNVTELVSKRDDPVTFLQMQPLPAKSKGCEGFRTSHPLLLVVASDESKSSCLMQNGRENLGRDGSDVQIGCPILSSTAVRFYSLRSHSYVHVLRFRSTVHMVRCSPRIVAVGLAAQIYCFDALTLENKFSVLTYPVPSLGGQGNIGVNIGYGPMDVGPRWLAYAPNNPLSSNAGRLSPKSLTPSPGISPSTSPSNGSLMARYAMESSKQLATGLINLSDMGYKTLSRYYQEFVPDGSSPPVSSNSSWKAVRAQSYSTDTDNAGVVVVKDFVSRAIISQFKAHSSPISALCFDPSGTLLVTASVHGNNINIFRIIPSSSKAGSCAQTYNWSSSHVHLYKLHRGVTSAVIQDIKFSPYSQWVAIITAKGTCHIFLLSPFGGETALHLHNSDVGQPTLSPALSLPWWSTPSFMTNQQSSSQFLPPPPVTVYVVSRIKNSSSGWLNSVSNVASSATGKICAPSGAAAAVFHSLALRNPQSSLAKVHPLEHLLVYSPSGHLVQYELLPSVGLESSETVSRSVSASAAQIQDEELRVKVEPLHWWDVCRRTNWPEREECIEGLTFEKKESVELVTDASGSEDNNVGDREMEKSCEHSHLYIAHAEVQMNSGRIPIWQQSKICFYTINSLDPEELALAVGHIGGELEIEKCCVNEIEIRRKDLLPVFDHFQKNRYDWTQRGFTEGTRSSTFSDIAKEKSSGGAPISYPQLDDSMENSNGSLENYYSPIMWSGNDTADQKQGHSILASPILRQNSANKNSPLVSSELHSARSPVDASNTLNRPLTLTIAPLSADRITVNKLEPSDEIGSGGASSTSMQGSNLMSNTIEEHVIHESLDFEHYFQEGYCQPSTVNRCRDSVEAVVDTDGNSSPCDREKSEEDEDNDDMLGGVFVFSEEG